MFVRIVDRSHHSVVLRIFDLRFGLQGRFYRVRFPFRFRGVRAGAIRGWLVHLMASLFDELFCARKLGFAKRVALVGAFSLSLFFG